MLSAIFLDRDGVINRNRVDHVKSWSEFRFLPGVFEAIRRLRRAGVPAFVITNQAIVNRGIASPSTVEAIHERMRNRLTARGGSITAIAYCPHRADELCACRKPAPGLILDLAACFAIDLRHAAVVGDALSDIAAAHAAGCRPVLVLTGRGRAELARAEALGQHDFEIARDLNLATTLLLERQHNQ